MQNNMRELFGLMNLLDPSEWSSVEEFFETYGGDAEPPTVEQIQALQVRIICCVCAPVSTSAALCSQCNGTIVAHCQQHCLQVVIFIQQLYVSDQPAS